MPEKTKNIVRCKQTRQRGINNLPGITQMIGQISELRVAGDLIAREFFVFNCITGLAPCDLIIFKRDKLYRVEVKTGHRTESGNLLHGKPTNSRYDILAVYIPEEDAIVYSPRIDGIIEMEGK